MGFGGCMYSTYRLLVFGPSNHPAKACRQGHLGRQTHTLRDLYHGNYDPWWRRTEWGVTHVFVCLCVCARACALVCMCATVQGAPNDIFNKNVCMYAGFCMCASVQGTPDDILNKNRLDDGIGECEGAVHTQHRLDLCERVVCVGATEGPLRS